jgi:hypothetical protein
MSGHEMTQEPGANSRIAAARHRELRNLLVAAADAARISRRTALRVSRIPREAPRAIRERLSSFLATL